MGLFALEHDSRDPIVLSVNSNPKEYFEITKSSEKNKKHKGISRGTKGMDLQRYKNKIVDYKHVKRCKEKIKQSRLQVKHNNVFLSFIDKTPLGQINDKFFYFGDGILSTIHGHDHLEKYYEYCYGKTLNDLLQDGDNIEEKIRRERACISKNKRLFILSQIYNGINCNNNKILKNDILSKY